MADRIARGAQEPSPLGTSLFVGLRSLDVFIQYGIVAKGLADPLLSLLRVSAVSPSNSAPIVALGLPLKPLIILTMAAGSAIKQIYWQLAVSNERMPPLTGTVVPIFNTLFNSVNSILSLTAAASYFVPSILSSSDNPTTLSPLFILGTVSYTVGILLETISEIQRKNFKADSKNTGKPYTGGLFSLARHINYGGYTIWRAGYAFAAGGWIAGTVIAGLFTYDFGSRAIPLLDEYCSKRYGASWVEFKFKVPYKLIPGIY